jgi:opacity protein-like surface antigen
VKVRLIAVSRVLFVVKSKEASFMRFVCTLLFNYVLVLNCCGQDNASPMDHPKKLISKVEILTGGSLVYGVWKGSEVPHAFKLGYSANLGLVHSLDRRFELNVRFLYEDKGIRSCLESSWSDDPPVIAKAITDITLNYLSVSVVPRYVMGDRGKFYVGIGPHASYLKNDRLRQEVYLNGELFQRSGAKPAKLGFKRHDIGMTIMGGCNLHVKNRTSATLQILYNAGIMDATHSGMTRFKNNTLTLLVGITIDKNVTKI